MSMTSTASTTVGRRLGVLIAGSLVVTALTAGTAAASVPTPMGIASPSIALRDGSSSRPRTPVPGFLLERGRYTRFDAPGAVQQTNALGINNRGVIVGKYTDAAGVQHGFRRDTHGRFTTIDVPGAAATHLNKLNDRGQVVGRDHQSLPARRWLPVPRDPAGQGRQGTPHPDRRPRRAKKRGDRSQRPRSARRLLREPQRRADPAAHRTAAGGPDGLTAGASSGEPSAPAPRPARVASPDHPGPGR